MTALKSLTILDLRSSWTGYRHGCHPLLEHNRKTQLDLQACANGMLSDRPLASVRRVMGDSVNDQTLQL